MAEKPSNKGLTSLAEQYVEKYLDIALKNNKQISKRFIAVIMLSEHPDLFKDIEHARLYVRKVTGAFGSEARASCPKFHDISSRFALLPECINEARSTEPFVMPTSIKNTLWVADIHGRFYDKRAFEAAVEYGVKKGCDSVIINGDFLDFYQHSKFDKNPSVSMIFEEQEWGQDVLEMLQGLFGTVVLKQGNHDIRRELHIARLAATMPELMGMSSYNDYLFFDGCHVNFVEDYKHIVYGKLKGFHGHEYYGGGGIHVAYNRFHKALDNIMSAHSHKSQSIIKPDINGHMYGSWTLGCLCNLTPRYSPKNDWNQGFARTEKDSLGEFEVDNRMFFRGKTFPV